MGDERAKDYKEYKDGNESSLPTEITLSEIAEYGDGAKVFIPAGLRPSTEIAPVAISTPTIGALVSQ